jgi:hypothetical protein
MAVSPGHKLHARRKVSLAYARNGIWQIGEMQKQIAALD